MNGLIGGTIRHYHILEQIGQGGMSSVFRASDARDQRRVAIRVLSPYLAHDPQFHARFEREIQLLRRLDHPNIIPILDFGEADGLAYIVMPYYGTGTLHQRLQHGPVDPVEGGRIIGEIAAALTCAQKGGVITATSNRPTSCAMARAMRYSRGSVSPALRTPLIL